MKSLLEFIDENKNVNESNCDFDNLYSDIVDRLQRWIEYGDSKRQEIRNIKRIIKDPSLNNGDVDDLIQQLSRIRKCDPKDLEKYFETPEGKKTLVAAAERSIQYY